MSAHPPPVPPEPRPRQGADSEAKPGKAGGHPDRDTPTRNPREQGQSGNTQQNTTNQGYQQDR